ncbi:MAG: hypothetical protein NWE89_05360 [Candidatus Bathyarchaeota archaeon]|nr:hypothetical protein [Candidatus Bathyarchaeota archaeon]
MQHLKLSESANKKLAEKAAKASKILGVSLKEANAWMFLKEARTLWRGTAVSTVPQQECEIID